MTKRKKIQRGERTKSSGKEGYLICRNGAKRGNMQGEKSGLRQRSGKNTEKKNSHGYVGFSKEKARGMMTIYGTGSLGSLISAIGESSALGESPKYLLTGKGEVINFTWSNLSKKMRCWGWRGRSTDGNRHGV